MSYGLHVCGLNFIRSVEQTALALNLWQGLNDRTKGRPYNAGPIWGEALCSMMGSLKQLPMRGRVHEFSYRDKGCNNIWQKLLDGKTLEDVMGGERVFGAKQSDSKWNVDCVIAPIDGVSAFTSQKRGAFVGTVSAIAGASPNVLRSPEDLADYYLVIAHRLDEKGALSLRSACEHARPIVALPQQDTVSIEAVVKACRGSESEGSVTSTPPAEQRTPTVTGATSRDIQVWVVGELSKPQSKDKDDDANKNDKDDEKRRKDDESRYQWLEAFDQILQRQPCLRRKRIPGSALAAGLTALIPGMGVNGYIGIVRRHTLYMMAIGARACRASIVAIPWVDRADTSARSNIVTEQDIVRLDDRNHDTNLDAIVCMTGINDNIVVRGPRYRGRRIIETQTWWLSASYKITRLVSTYHNLEERIFRLLTPPRNHGRMGAALEKMGYKCKFD